MDSNDKEEFMKEFTTMCEIYDKTASKALLAIYFETLRAFTVEKIKQAIIQHVKTSKFFPNPSDLLDLLQGNQYQIAEKEAQAVIALINHEGRYADYKHRLSPETITTINNRFGGWGSLCAFLETSKFNWFVKEFKEAYSAVKTQVPQIDHDQAKQLLTNFPKLKAV